MNRFADLKKECKELLEIVQEIDPEYLLNDYEIRNYLVAAALRIWGANRQYAPEYAGAVEAIAGFTYTPAQIMTAMECASEEDRMLNVPDFVIQAVEYDLEEEENNSREIIDSAVRLLAAMAAVNGDLTLEEAIVLENVADSLHHYADDKGIPKGSSLYNISDYVTPRREGGYWTESSLEEEEAGAATDRTVNGSEEKKEQNKTNASSAGSSPARPVVEENGEITAAVDEQETPASEETLAALLEELNSLVGLGKVKKDVQSLLNFIKVCRMREKRGFKAPAISYHLVFTGNPGTGKTTVARLIAKIYYHMGLLSKGQLVEADRSTLVAGYLGQTAVKTQKVIQSALGGVLFIDEAYSLVNDERDSYGKEAIETLLKAMEDHRDELVVIVAGYDELMHKFIDSNPGLRSRFNKYFQFPDYNGDELSRIFERFCQSNGYVPEAEATGILTPRFAQMYENRREHFGNARDVRNLFEKAIHHQANRVAAKENISDLDLIVLSAEDVRNAFEEEL